MINNLIILRLFQLLLMKLQSKLFFIKYIILIIIELNHKIPEFFSIIRLVEKGGAIVVVPSGKYLFRGNIDIPKGVTLKGMFGSVPSHSGFPKIDDLYGSVLLPTANKGKKDAEPFITVRENGTL